MQQEYERICALIKSANEELEENAIHIQENGSGNYVLYFMADGEPQVCEENIPLDKLYKRIETLRDTLK